MFIDAILNRYNFVLLLQIKSYTYIQVVHTFYCTWKLDKTRKPDKFHSKFVKMHRYTNYTTCVMIMCNNYRSH